GRSTSDSVASVVGGRVATARLRRTVGDLAGIGTAARGVRRVVDVRGGVSALTSVTAGRRAARRARVTACRDAALADVRRLRGNLRLNRQHQVADARRLVVAVLGAGVTGVGVGGG